MTTTFTLTGNLADFADEPRGGVEVLIFAMPRVKVGDTSVHSNDPERAVTDADGVFTQTLVSIPGLWYSVRTSSGGHFNPITFAAYTPDGADPSTGVEFPADWAVNLRDIVNEDPTPGYAAIAYLSIGEGGGGVTDHGSLTGRGDDDHPQYALADGSRGNFAPAAAVDALTDALMTEVTTRGSSDSTLTAAGAALSGRVDALEAAPGPDVTAADLTAHAADTIDIHGIADTAALVLTGDPRLADPRTPVTHTHTSAQVIDFAEAAQDAVAALLAGASGVSLTYDDAANTLTITGGGTGGLDAEAVRDAIGVALIGSGLVTVTVNDALDTITISTTATANSTDALLRDRSTHTGVQGIATVAGLQDALDSKGTSDFDGAYGSLTGAPALGTAAATDATAYATAAQGAVADTAVQGDDPRLSDSRTPTAHTHDDRYLTEGEVTSALTGKADTSHGHVIADTTGLQGALDGKQAAGSYAATSHTHTTGQVTGLDAALTGKAAATHSHPITDLTATGVRDATTFLRGDGTWETGPVGAPGAPGVSDVVFAPGTTAEDIPPGTPANTLVVLY